MRNCISILPEKTQDDQHIHEKVLTSTSHQRNASQNHSGGNEKEILFSTGGMKTDVACMESSMEQP